MCKIVYKRLCELVPAARGSQEARFTQTLALLRVNVKENYNISIEILCL